MASIERAIDVDVPVTVAFNQWTQFEDYPRFMEGVERVEQLDGDRLRWTVNTFGKRETWDAEILEQIPDLLISWSAVTIAKSSATVTFSSADGERTRVSMLVEYDPDWIPESIGDKLAFMSRRIEGNLERFKRFVERRHRVSWPGELGAGSAFHP